MAMTAHRSARNICRIWRMVSSLLAGIPFSSLSVEGGMAWLLTRGERRRRNRLQGGRLHLGTVAGIKSEWWPTSPRNRWPACVGILTTRLGGAESGQVVGAEAASAPSGRGHAGGVRDLKKAGRGGHGGSGQAPG